MASRTSTPATPTVRNTTDDSSRGSLFGISNVGDIVTGSSTPRGGVAASDAQITIQINDNAQNFTLNQLNNETLTFNIDEAADTNTTYTLSLADTTLTLTGSDGMSSSVSLPDSSMGNPVTTIAYTQANNELALTLMDSSVVTGTLDVGVTTVNGTAPDAAGNVEVALVAALGYAVGQATTIGTSTLTFNSLVVDATTGLELIADGMGVRLTSMDTPIPPMPSGGTTRTIAPDTTALAPAPAPEVTVTPNNGVITSVTTTLSGVDPDGADLPVSITQTPTIPPGGTADPVDITYPDSDTSNPATDYTPPGVYTVTTTTTTDNDETDPVTVTDVETFTRYIPFFMSRTEPTTAQNLLDSTFVSEAGWSNEITAIAGRNVLYFSTTALAATTGVVTAMTNTGFPVRYASIRTIPVTDANGDTLTYTVFRAPASAGVVLAFS